MGGGVNMLENPCSPILPGQVTVGKKYRHQSCGLGMRLGENTPFEHDMYK